MKFLRHAVSPVFALFVACGAAPAAPPLLELPIRCVPGRDCFIQNHVDRDPGPGFRDYRCGPLGYDGHAGTDFRVPNLAAMDAGVPVLAAAPGVVVAVRDGEPDVSLRERQEPLRGDRMAGNGVRIDHGDGWVTQYSHLRRGSVRVQPGQRVATGEELGLVGLSGNTEFPHVDFAVSHQRRTVDPFATDSIDRCGETEGSLWSAEAARQLAYRPSALLGAGFAPFAPTHGWAQRGTPAPVVADSPALCFWIELLGLREGDLLSLELQAPNGELLARSERAAGKNQAVWFAFVGKKLSLDRWPAGRYRGSLSLRRGGTVILVESRTLAIEPP